MNIMVKLTGLSIAVAVSVLSRSIAEEILNPSWFCKSIAKSRPRHDWYQRRGDTDHSKIRLFKGSFDKLRVVIKVSIAVKRRKTP